MNSPKYPKTPHFPYSPGVSNDDRIIKSPYRLIGVPIIISEKCDGSNCSWEATGCYARTHAHTPTHPSFDACKAMHANAKHLLEPNTQVFGEWMYAVHSIEYSNLPGYFLVFGVRYLDQELWISWAEVDICAQDLEVPTVPVLWTGNVRSETELREIVEELAAQPSACGGEREGVVVRIADSFEDADFDKCVAKWVRPSHIKTDAHWAHQPMRKNMLRP
jgi:hypothetical protein